MSYPVQVVKALREANVFAAEDFQGMGAGGKEGRRCDAAVPERDF